MKVGKIMVTIILVSHSRKITDGLKEMIEEMTGKLEHILIVSAGGTDDGRLGTDPINLKNEIEHRSLFPKDDFRKIHSLTSLRNLLTYTSDQFPLHLKT